MYHVVFLPRWVCRPPLLSPIRHLWLFVGLLCILIFIFNFITVFIWVRILLSLSRSNCVYCCFYYCIVFIYSAAKLPVCFNKLTYLFTYLLNSSLFPAFFEQWRISSNAFGHVSSLQFDNVTFVTISIGCMSLVYTPLTAPKLSVLGGTTPPTVSAPWPRVKYQYHAME